MQRVVITGLGLVTPNGVGARETWDSVLAAKSGIKPITSFDASEYATRFGGEVRDFQATDYLSKRRVREMGRYAHFAVAASKMCLADAGIDLTDEDRERCGTFIGVGMGGLEYVYHHSVALYTKGPSKVSPYFVPHVIANLAGGHVAIELGLRGPSYSNTSACASSAHAIGEAFEWIRRGRTPIMLAGGSEACVTELGIAGFSAMFALSRRNQEPERASRPWDVDRDGFVCGEGAGSLLLESLEHAERRGAKIYAEVLGYGATCDAYHMTKPAPGGEGAVRAMKMALEDAKLSTTDIDYVNAHGTSTPQGDVEEAKALLSLFGAHASERRLWVSSTKSVMGHLLGGAGGVEAALCALALRDGRVPPTANLERVDPEACGLDFVPLTARERDLRYVMSNSFGFGGTNATLVLGKPR